MQTKAKMRPRWAPLAIALCSLCIVPLGGHCNALLAPPSKQPLKSNATGVGQLVSSDNSTLATTDCASCSSEEISAHLQRIVQDDSILRNFLELEESKAANVSLPGDIRLTCMRELIELIRDMASNELEMKTILEFATDAAGSSSAELPASKPARSRPARPEQRNQRRQCDKTGKTAGAEQASQTAANPEDLNVVGQQSDKSRALAKLVANVDHWILALERFTLTREWASLVKVFKGVENILEMFSTKEAAQKVPTSTSGRLPPLNKTSGPADELLESLRANLPGQVMTLTSSLNSLFPWHVWPWNNLDLYSTVNTFLNHGIFAFGKTTVGPERRIDYLHDMLQTLFRSLKLETFPKKCQDWSRVICDPLAFHEQLALAPAASEQESKERELKVKQLASKDSRSQLTQELTCIMFSSLSMQHFGGQQESNQEERQEAPVAGNRLPWDRQVHKALKLYTLAREALTDEQWLALYQVSQSLWSEQKISERLIMAGRVIQLLTNCHMPREMLESALWKDIYKYKNVLNQLLDIVVEELNRSSESGRLSLDQVSLGSAHLHEILRRLVELLPRLMEASSRTITEQLPEMVNLFFAERGAFFRAPCKGASLGDLVPELKQHRAQIVEIEERVCKQLKTKPNITMWQINHLTNEFLAMAFNLSGNFAGVGLSLPRLMLSNLSEQSKPSAQVSSTVGGREPSLASGGAQENSSTVSIVDEMASNPRLAQIVAILQSSALDPPEVHAELPELDWVEAGTSIALLYESIQKLLSYEAAFEIFPEIPGFQQDFERRLATSRALFRAMSKRDPIRLAAYALDTVMPVALRTFKPMESFSAECQASFRDIFSDQDLAGDSSTGGKPHRQWQCFVSSANFASWATNQFMRTLNSMFRSVLAQASPVSELAKVGALSANGTSNNNDTCIFLDGSVSLMLDNLPQFIDLALETVLMASTTADEQPATLYDTMCSSNFTLDPFDERSVELRIRMKSKMCHLFHKRSLANCQRALELDQWRATMRQLNSTWFQADALSVNSSFRDITLSVHEFLELFGRLKPSTMSDSLLARVLNVNSFWTNLLNRTTKIIDKYQEKRFEYALQTLTPIIYDNLPSLADLEATNSTQPEDSKQQVAERRSQESKQVRETLMATILAAKAVLNYLDKPSQAAATLAAKQQRENGHLFNGQLQRLFAWADQYSIVAAESLLRTMAHNITKLEGIFSPLNASELLSNSTGNQSVQDTWSRFCSAPIGTYLVLNGEATANATAVAESDELRQMETGQREICAFEWRAFYELLNSRETSNEILADYPERQLTRIALTKWGQVLDVMLIESKRIKQLPKFFYMDYWQQLVRYKLPQMSPYKEQPSNLLWIWRGVERLVQAADSSSSGQISGALQRILDQLNCGLDAVKGGLSWENIANIYSDKQDILAAHSTINNGFALASIGVNTFLVHKKFQRLLDQLVKPGRSGLAAFCEMRDRRQLEAIFSIPQGDAFLQALESFQELLCDTNFDTLAQNINPISVCYQIAGANGQPDSLADNMDRFFKLASLAVLDAKLVVASDAKPPILDKNQWTSFWSWWAEQAEPRPKSGAALAAVRALQLLDSVNADHVVWKALFKSLAEATEVAAYLFRALERRELELAAPAEPQGPRLSAGLSLVKEAASQLDSALRRNASQPWEQPGGASQQQQLASTLANIMFPEVNNFISFRTFKQVRYIKIISDFFATSPAAQTAVCKRLLAGAGSAPVALTSKIELIGFRLSSNERLFALMCHYDSSQWLTVLNIVLSGRTHSIPKKVGHMTSYLSSFARHYQDEEQRLEQFVHGRQLEQIESVANTSAAYLLAASQSLKSLSFQKIGNLSWHSLPNLFDSIDRHLCASKHQPGGFHLARYEPKKPDLETLVCRLPQWNMTQVYDYISENFDLQNMISLITTTTTTTTGQSITQTAASNNNATNQAGKQVSVKATCVTPFKFASRWLKVSQDVADEAMSKAARAKIRKCLAANRAGQSVSGQSLRYVRMVNGLMGQLDQLTSSNSWQHLKRGWSSVSQLLVNQLGPAKGVGEGE